MNYDIISLVITFGIRSETWLYRQIAELKQYRVHVITYQYLHPEEYPFSPVTVLPSPNRVIRGFLKAPILLLEGKRPRLDLRERLIISRIVAKEKIKIIQAHFGWAGYRFLELAVKLSKPYLVWVYGPDVFRSPYQKSLEELIASPVILCCTSNALRNQIIEYGGAPERIYVFYPGIKVPAKIPEKTFDSNQKIKIISIGRLTECKDPCGMVEIAKIIKDRGINFIWEHLGDGELRAEVEEKIKNYHLESHFYLRGEVPNNQVWESLKSSDLMVHNAKVNPDGSREAFGVVLTEASAMGVPIISVRVGGIPEIVKDKKTGFLVEIGDLEGMAEKVILLAKNPELRRQIGINAYQYVRENFEINQQIKKLESFYSTLINRSY